MICVGMFCSQQRAASFTYFGEVSRCPHKRIVTTTKVYIARNNIHVEILRFSVGDGGGRVPPTFQLGGDHIGNVPPPTFLLKKWKISCVLSPSNLHSLSACVIDTGVYK